MQTFEIRVLNADGSVQQSSGAQFSEADIVRFMAMVSARYPTVDVPADGDTPATSRPAKDAESFAMWSGGIALGTIANMQSYERELAQAKLDDPAPVQFTPVKA